MSQPSSGRSGPGEHRLLDPVDPLARPAEKSDLPELEEDRAGGCMNQLAPERQLQHRAIALGNRDEPGLGADEFAKAQPVYPEHFVAGGIQGRVGAAQSTAGVITNPERVA